jgi:putative methyltransferase (TIGR04325 family)
LIKKLQMPDATESIRPSSIWEGVYRSFADVPKEREIFTNNVWLSRLEATFESVKTKYANKTDASAGPQENSYLLPLVLTMAHQQMAADAEHALVKVLDFGGGFGASYLECKARIPSDIRIDYRVIDKPEVIERGKDIASAYPEVSFLIDIADARRDFKDIDIVHIGSTLHYIEDWKACLQELCALSPKYIVLDDLLAGPVLETFVTAQKYYDTNIPVWVWNETDFVNVVKDLGYNPIYRTNYFGGLTEAGESLPMLALPESRRLPHPINLLFVKP